MVHHRRAVRLVALGFIAALVASAMTPMAAFGKGPEAARALGLNDERLLADAVAEGKSAVTVLIAAKGGQLRQAEAAVAAAGGSIAYRNDAIGYLRAVVSVANVRQLAANASIEALDLDETFVVPDPRPEGVLPILPQPAPTAATDNDNPYMPIRDVGSSQFVDANPTWDGRGVTIGIIDTGVSLDHPSLLTTSTGERKIVDWVAYTDPTFNSAGVNSDGDPTWLNMSAQVSGASFDFGGFTWTAPAAGTYRIGVFRENQPTFGGEFNASTTPGGDLNRDGDEVDVFGALWDTSTNQVWVDSDANRSFADNSPMTDYKVNFDIGWFGTDNPATAVAERVPFVVQTDGRHKAVNIGIVAGAHASHVTGIAAGNSLFGGSMTGAAPGAQVVSVRVCVWVPAVCSNHALIEGMIYAAVTMNVDVINMSIGGLPALNDANNARARLYDRLIDLTNAQMFISAGNSGPGMNTVGDPSVATKVMSVGAYITDETYLADYGALLYEDDNLHYFSSRGPREDGGFKPNIVAPGAAISSWPMWQNQGCIASTCPVGYALANGTSMAAPQAAGGTALLISAAKQAGVQYQPPQLRQALNSSARFLTGRYQAYEQGNGLMNVGAAWDLLTTNIPTVSISSAVAVNTILSGFLATPGIGVGIYDREGVVAGFPYTRTYTFNRTSGGGGSITYNLSWVDNDGTFSSASSITLPKGAPVDLVVNVNPTTSGAHSAILNVDDPATAGIDYQTMNTVIAADEFVAPDYAVTKTGSVGPGQFETFFFRVPAGTPALKVDMVGGGETNAGAIRFLRWHPWGLGIDSNAVSNCYNGAPGGCTTGSPTSRTVSNPQAGVWEVTVDARRNSDAVSAPFTLTVSTLGATVSPNPDLIESATIGVPVDRSYTITNLFGAFTGRAVGTALGSAFRDTPTIAEGELDTYFVTIPAGATSLRATIGNPSDPAADLDLYVDNCTATPGTCVQAAMSADGDSEESVTIASPAAGQWRVRVDGFAIPAGTTTYNYVDVFAHPSFGAVSVTDANALREAGASWTVPGQVTVTAAPEAGRVLLGQVQVLTDADILVGTGDVVVQSVVASP
jgi:subtilisin family serine protease